MTAQEATQFDGYSMANAMIVSAAAAKRGCQCRPYEDWYTYKRWQAQGYQVQRGERGVRLSTFVTMTKTDEDLDDSTESPAQSNSAEFDKGNKVVVGKRPWTSIVFCRCQVKVKSI